MIYWPAEQTRRSLPRQVLRFGQPLRHCSEGLPFFKFRVLREGDEITLEVSEGRRERQAKVAAGKLTFYV